MRKIFIIAIATMAILALGYSFAFAGVDCNAKKSAACRATCSLTETGAHQADAKAKACSPAEKEACAAKLGISVEECEAMCKSGSLTMINMSVKGMTCAGCEADVKTALQAVPGVMNVGEVCHKSGSATVFFDTSKGKSDAVVSAVVNKGYKAEIIPAVATTTTGSDAKMASSKTCSIGSKAACCAAAAKKTSTTKTSADGTQ